MAGKDVAKQTETQADLVSAILTLPEAIDQEDASEVIVARILAAESVEEILTPQSAPSLRDIEGVGIVIHDARRRESDMNPGVPFFLLLDVEDRRTGKHSVYSTGALNVMAQIAKMHSLGKLPFPCHVVSVVSKSNAGRSSQWLVSDAAEEPF